MYVRVIRHHNETCGWHVCAGRVKHVVDLNLTVARRRQGDLRSPGGAQIGEHDPKKSR